MVMTMNDKAANLSRLSTVIGRIRHVPAEAFEQISHVY